MIIHAYKHAQLMEESELRVNMAAHSSLPADLVASRLLECPETYRHWEAEHDRLMRAVSEHAKLARQVTALRATAFGLVHRRGMFQYLRGAHLSGQKRRRLFGLFYGCRDYANAVLFEHGNYVRCSSSYLATHYLGEQLMHDAAFDEPLQLYEQFYSEYFRAYCDIGFAETEEERQVAQPLEALRPLLKYRLSEARQAILAMPLCQKRNGARCGSARRMGTRSGCDRSSGPAERRAAFTVAAAAPAFLQAASLPGGSQFLRCHRRVDPGQSPVKDPLFGFGLDTQCARGLDMKWRHHETAAHHVPPTPRWRIDRRGKVLRGKSQFSESLLASNDPHGQPGERAFQGCVDLHDGAQFRKYCGHAVHLDGGAVTPHK